ncbi:tetratricopeptide repeat protein [Calothrix sp. FACHB-156]|nr:tetratricopeptide repeat protein [Calothrix sp. FACHB-156]
MNNLFYSETILAEMGINSNTVKLMKQGLKRTSYRAVINWLTKYNPNINASNLEKSKGLLEAFFHLCAVEDVESAWNIIHCRLNTPTQEYLLEQLRTWGYYQQLEDLCSHLLDKPLDDTKSAILLNCLGVTCSSKGDYNLAIDFYKKSLYKATQFLDCLPVGDIYCNMSFCYFYLEKFNKAIEYAEKSLEIAKSNQDERLQSKSLYYLAIAYFYLGEDANKTISDIKEAISIAQRIQADFLIAKMIGDLGNVYSELGMCEEAYKMYQQRLDIAISRQDKPGEAIALCNLGNLFRKMEAWDKAIEYLEKAINISKEIQDKETEAQSYSYLCLLFEKIDDKARAIAACKQAHYLAQFLPIPLAQESHNAYFL